MSSFSGYTEGLYPILATNTDVVTIGFQMKVSIGEIAINGLCTRVVKIEKDHIAVQRVREVAVDSLRFISISMPSSDKDLYLLDGVSHGVAILQKREKANNHAHTLRLVFEVNKQLYEEVAVLKYIGLNGSSFFVQEMIKDREKFFVSVHAGRMTREKTIFSESGCEIGEECVVSFPSS